MKRTKTGSSLTAAVLAVGDELISERPDTNGLAIAAVLEAAGWNTVSREAAPDNAARVARRLRALLREHALVVVCGGLGPTEDDITREAAARALDRPLRHSPLAWRQVRAWFRRRRRPVPEVNRVQARMPRGAAVLSNSWGTAPGFLVRSGAAWLAALPGPPAECLPMLTRRLLPRLRRAAPAAGTRVWRRDLRTCGAAEAALQMRLGPWFAAAGRPRLGFLLDEPGEILVKLSVHGRDARRARRALDLAGAFVRRELGADLIGPAARPLPAAVGRLLVARGQTLAVAESCTGGLISRRLTSVPGSSRYFREGVVAYTNDAKTARLGVPRALLARSGAVSEAAARSMAEGARRTAHADWGLAVTGIAGPGGGSRSKPVGTVCWALAGPGGRTWAWTARFPGGRDLVQRRSATSALDALRRALQATAKEAEK